MYDRTEVLSELQTLVQLDGRWQITSKVFHFDLRGGPSSG
jgi:hypothetical protein